MYYLGVDAGGTKTTAALVNDGADVIDIFKFGSGNVVSLGPEKTAELIENIISKITAKYRIEDVAWSTFGFAGAGRAAEKNILETIIRNNRINNFTIMTDAEIMHYSIFAFNSGILISAGTGSVCLVKTEDSKFFQLGGHGFLLGDEGSGFYIGKMAIKKALDDAETNRSETMLTKKILDFYQIHKPKEIISKTYNSDSSQKLISSCAKIVCELAEKNEPNAFEIADDAANTLINLVGKAIKNYWPANAEVNVAIDGGILQHGSIVRKLFEQKIQDYSFNIRYFSCQMSPAAAAAMYSMSQSGLKISDTVIRKLKNIHSEAVK